MKGIAFACNEFGVVVCIGTIVRGRDSDSDQVYYGFGDDIEVRIVFSLEQACRFLDALSAGIPEAVRGEALNTLRSAPWKERQDRQPAVRITGEAARVLACEITAQQVTSAPDAGTESQVGKYVIRVHDRGAIIPEDKSGPSAQVRTRGKSEYN